MIRTENIYKSYGDLEVLKGVDLEIKKGEVISIVGASGAGKSTLLQIIGTLDHPDQGKVSINDIPIVLNSKKNLTPASFLKRLANHTIDLFVIVIIYAAISFFFISTNFQGKSFNIIAGFYILFGLFITKQLYYIALESLWSKTIGKAITKTIVIAESGNPPSLSMIIIRSLVRSIPFEPLSFIFSKNPIGWHDKFSNTITISHNRLNNDSGNGLTDKELSLFRNKNIGFVFQFHHLLPEFTALENVCIPAFIHKTPKAEAESKALKLLTDLGLADRADHKPSELSGGEQQRVAVCRALINNPTVILADEPSGNLDSNSAKELHELFFQLRDEHKQTFIIVTHNEELANMADRKLTMKDGKIIN